MIEYQRGIHIVGTTLWLDSRNPQDISFVSHGHVDHLGSHSMIIASRPTVKFYEHRLQKTKTLALDYHTPCKPDGMEIEIFPAGHILGSAQIRVGYQGQTIIYSGDFRLKQCLTAEPISVKEADILIMEATYGRPHFLFPDRMIVMNQLAELIDKTLAEKQIPVVLAYSLGKGQEAAKFLGDRGYPLIVHKTIYDLLKIYEDFGITFQNYSQFSSIVHSEGKVLIMPPYLVTSAVIKNIKKKRIILLSGWALDKTKVSPAVDEVLPVSDHADFNELLEYVRTVNPQKIYITHGTPDFVGYLKEAGYDASFLK